MAYKVVYIELSGRCNAKCRWCSTGIENFRNPVEMPAMRKNTMSAQKFRAIVKHLFSEKMADANTAFGFYNWGEPFLNPELNEILIFMHENKLKYSLSTNGSVKFDLKAPPQVFNELYHLVFSFCGFSQHSYDKIHKLSFPNVVENVKNLVSTIRNNGGKNCKMRMSYHLYQFNWGQEMLQAKRFCDELQIVFVPMFAYINDFRRSVAYLEGEMDYVELRDMAKDLYLFYVDDLLKQCPPNYRCPQYDILTIDENGVVLPCCSVIDETLGDILEMDAKTLASKKQNVKACIKCLLAKQAFWVHNPFYV